MSSNPKNYISADEYLEIERQSEFRNEYFNGQMFAMAGASRIHNRIITNLVTSLDNQLRERQCNVYANDFRVRIDETGLYTYPDVIVTCGEEMIVQDKNLDLLLNPMVVIEVLSDTTEAYDRGEKFLHYQQIESLMEYLLVSQTPYRVEHFVRQQGQEWLYTEMHDPENKIILPSIQCEIQLREVYLKVIERRA